MLLFRFLYNIRCAKHTTTNQYVSRGALRGLVSRLLHARRLVGGRAAAELQRGAVFDGEARRPRHLQDRALRFDFRGRRGHRQSSLVAQSKLFHRNGPAAQSHHPGIGEAATAAAAVRANDYCLRAGRYGEPTDGAAKGRRSAAGVPKRGAGAGAQRLHRQTVLHATRVRLCHSTDLSHKRKQKQEHQQPFGFKAARRFARTCSRSAFSAWSRASAARNLRSSACSCAFNSRRRASSLSASKYS